jgi:hypothetical protein
MAILQFDCFIRAFHRTNTGKNYSCPCLTCPGWSLFYPLVLTVCLSMQTPDHILDLIAIAPANLCAWLFLILSGNGFHWRNSRVNDGLSHGSGKLPPVSLQ